MAQMCISSTFKVTSSQPLQPTVVQDHLNKPPPTVSNNTRHTAGMDVKCNLQIFIFCTYSYYIQNVNRKCRRNCIPILQSKITGRLTFDKINVIYIFTDIFLMSY